jgi:hypothetical protein
MQLGTPTARKIAALLFPIAFQGLTVLGEIATKSPKRPQGDDSWIFLVILAVSIVVSSLILGRTSFDRFWKIFLSSCFAAALPSYLVMVVQSIRVGVGGYFWLGFITMNFLLILAALCSLPFAGLFYWSRGRQSSREVV